jgi:hypothetical protein
MHFQLCSQTLLCFPRSQRQQRRGNWLARPSSSFLPSSPELLLRRANTICPISANGGNGPRGCPVANGPSPLAPLSMLLSSQAAAADITHLNSSFPQVEVASSIGKV